MTATYCYDKTVRQPLHIGWRTVFILIILAILVVATWVNKLNQHAIERHGALAIATVECLDGKGKWIASFRNPLTQRLGEVCEQDDKYYVLIIEIAMGVAAVVTAFCKDQMAGKPWKVKRYMRNAGYTLGGRNMPDGK